VYLHIYCGDQCPTVSVAVIATDQQEEVGYENTVTRRKIHNRITLLFTHLLTHLLTYLLTYLLTPSSAEVKE